MYILYIYIYIYIYIYMYDHNIDHSHLQLIKQTFYLLPENLDQLENLSIGFAPYLFRV